ncbi:MAG: glucose-6-phosphate isomerase [Alphaproteobacteria bacterium]|nr:glucose-6-phosphate isomerase [Alphaproteobacteria bacterium]
MTHSPIKANWKYVAEGSTLNFMRDDSPLLGIDIETTSDLEATPALYAALEKRRQHYQAQPLPLFEAITRDDDLAPMQSLAANWRGAAKHIVIIGMGGASLGGQVLAQLHGHLSPLSALQSQKPHLIFTETLDGDEIEALFSASLKDMRFLIISKSGTTIETLMQTQMLLSALESAPIKAAEVALIISDRGDNPLRILAATHNIPVWDHEADIGGRYSVISNVGLLPCLLAGGDALALKYGAASVLDDFLTQEKSAPQGGAALQIAHNQAGRAISVLMPYTAKLERFTFWYRQLWAESLGKQGQAILPVNALGPADQHSQLQLYSAGADDKFYTLITAPIKGDYGRLHAASAQAMAQTLTNSARPVRVIRLATLNDATLGGLFMHFMLETILVGDVLGINPFDQPAVDDVKIRTRQILETL